MKREGANSVTIAKGEQPCFSGFLYVVFFMLSMSMFMR